MVILPRKLDQQTQEVPWLLRPGLFFGDSWRAWRWRPPRLSPLGRLDAWWSHDQNNMVVFANILQYANMLFDDQPMCKTYSIPCIYIYIYNVYIYMHMLSTCIDFIPMCIYVYLCVYFVHVLTTAYIERVQQRTTGGPSAGHHSTVQVYFEGRNLERLRPLSGLDGSPFRRLGCFF